MKRAFRSVPQPGNGLVLDVIDNDSFLVLRLDTGSLMKMSGEEKKRSIVYVIELKRALEQAGAVVLILRTPFEDA